MKTLKADISGGNLNTLVDSIQNGLKGVVKFTKEQVANTLEDLGNIPISFTPNQVMRMNKAKKEGKGMKLTLTEAQTRKVKNGGFLPALLPALGGIAKVAGPVLAKGALGGLASGGVATAIKKLFGSGMKPINLGDGMYLSPYNSGSGLRRSQSCSKCVLQNKNTGESMVVEGGFLKSILNTVSSVLPF